MAITTLAVIAAVGAAAAVKGTIDAKKASKRSAAAQQQQNDLATARNRRQGIRERQLKRAQAISSAGGVGAGDSSGAIGGIGALGSQLGADLGFGSQQGALSNIITQQNLRAQNASGIANLGLTTFSAAGGFGAF